jgi:hypothetical protein
MDREHGMAVRVKEYFPYFLAMGQFRVCLGSYS